MKITMRPMSVEEAWTYILWAHGNFHGELKKFGYSYNFLVPKPDNEHIKAMFEKEILTESDVKFYKDFFVNEIYDVKDLQRLDDLFEKSVKANLERGINKFLVPLLPSWNATLPETLEILCTYGGGAGYWRKNDKQAIIYFRMSRYLGNEFGMCDIFFHEFVHMLIEEPIIQKYKVPQDLKERIVDLICYEFIQKPVDELFANSFANAYITPEAIKTNLPATVKKMMADYNAMNNPDK